MIERCDLVEILTTCCWVEVVVVAVKVTCETLELRVVVCRHPCLKRLPVAKVLSTAAKTIAAGWGRHREAKCPV